MAARPAWVAASGVNRQRVESAGGVAQREVLKGGSLGPGLLEEGALGLSQPGQPQIVLLLSPGS